MCKAKLHLKSPWELGVEKEEERTPSQLPSSKQQGNQAVVFKISVRYAASAWCRKHACSGDTVIKSNKTKSYLNKAKMCPSPFCVHRNRLQGRYLALVGDTCGFLFLFPGGESRDLDQKGWEWALGKASQHSLRSQTEWWAKWRWDLWVYLIGISQMKTALL